MSILAFTLAFVAQAAPAQDPGRQYTFPSAAAAFERGMAACEEVYSAGLSGERGDPNKPNLFSRHGFRGSRSPVDPRVEPLKMGSVALVFAADVGGAGQVYVILTRQPLACRVASFDAPDSHRLAYNNVEKRGWKKPAKPTVSSSAAAKMQLFDKKLRGGTASVNISWPAAPGPGPSGLSAMATMMFTPR